MNPRISAAVGLLALLLCTVGYLVLFHDLGYEPDDPIAAVEPGMPAEDPVKKDVVEASSPSNDDREELDKAETGRVETVKLDPFFLASLSGFKGRLVDHEKQPAPQKLIRFYRADPSAVIHNPGLFHLAEDVTHATPRLEIKEARTDEKGRFLITGAWPGTFYVYEADADGEQVTRRLVQRVPSSGEIVDLGDIVLQLHGIIVGRVENDDGDPVVGALVRAVDLGPEVPTVAMAGVPLERFDIDGALIIRGDMAPLVIEFPAWAKTYYDMVPIPKTHTNAEGEFRLTGVMPGNNVLVVNAKNLQPYVKAMVKVKPGKEKNVRTIRLREGEIVQGRVVDEEEKPVVGAEVLVANRSLVIPADFASHFGPTDKDGRFSGSGFRPGEVTAAARTRPGEPWVVVGPESVAADIVIRLPSRHSLTVRLKSNVRDSIEKVTFKLLPSHGGNNAIDIGTMGLVRWIDVDRRVEKLKDGRYRINELRKGRYDLAVQVDGHGVGRLKFELAGDLEQEIQLHGQTPFVVIVTDAAGKAVQNAVVYAEARRDWRKRSELVHGMPLKCGWTGKDGRLLVDNIQQGKVRLTASHPAYGSAHREFNTPQVTEVHVAFETPGRITGLLTENGSQPTPGKWTIIAMRQRDGTRGAMPDIPTMQVPNVAGEFEIKGLRPGKYRLEVVKSMDAITSPGGIFPYFQRQSMAGGGVRHEVTIAVGATEHVVIDAVKQPEILTGPKARIQGAITLNGRPGAGMLISGRAGTRFTVTADAAGRFDLGERRAGNWISFEVRKAEDANIFTGRRDGVLYRFGRRVKDGENLDLNIVIETGRASGTVFGINGYPVKNVRVRATGQISPRNKGEGVVSSINQSTETDAKGQFAFEDLPAGNYSFEVQESHGHGAISDVEVPAGLAAAGLTVKLAAVYDVSGRVDMAFFGDKKPRWMWIEVVRQTKRRHGQWFSASGANSTFKMRNLVPGRYTVAVRAAGYNTSEGDLIADPFEVINQDIKDLVLRPRIKPQPKPKPKPKKKNEKKR